MKRVLPLLLLAACGGKAEVIIGSDQAANYEFCSTLTAQSIDVKPLTDLTIDWCDLDTSLLGAAIAPGDINTASIARAPDLSQEELLDAINKGTIATADFDAFAQYTPTGADDCDALTSEFGLNGTALDPSVDLPAGPTYFASVGAIDQTSGFTTYHMFTFFNPTEGEENLLVPIVNDSAHLGYTVDIDVSTFPVPFGTDKIHIDWASLEKNGCDQDVDLSDIDRVLVARYDEGTADIEADFLHVRELAEESYLGDVTGYGDAWLDQVLEDEAGDPFPGFDDNGTWLIALECSTCLNPSPPFLAKVVEE